jgi:acyl-CoA synthetase (AMP-forming)/AMP-acid ligase II
VGAPDDERGEVVVLHIVLAEGAPLPDVLDEIEVAAEQRLAPYKRPREIRVVDEVPRDSTGKLLRRLLRED